MMRILSVLCLLSLLFSCKSTHYTPKTYKAAQLTIGSSGGVSGTIREYILLDNGQLFMSKGINGELKELRKIGKGETARIFKKADELGIGTLKFNHPGNMTYSLTLKKSSGTNAVSWGESGIPAPTGIKEFYDYLVSLVQP
jgi:hypothetical protein